MLRCSDLVLSPRLTGLLPIPSFGPFSLSSIYLRIHKPFFVHFAIPAIALFKFTLSLQAMMFFKSAPDGSSGVGGLVHDVKWCFAFGHSRSIVDRRPPRGTVNTFDATCGLCRITPRPFAMSPDRYVLSAPGSTFSARGQLTRVPAPSFSYLPPSASPLYLSEREHFFTD